MAELVINIEDFACLKDKSILNCYAVLQIGPKEMYESHEKLKGMKSKSADLGKTLREKQRELEDEQRKNQLLERDVERFKNRQKYMSRIGYLKKKKLWVVSEGKVGLKKCYARIIIMII